MDHSTAPPIKKRSNVCKFFRKLTNIPFFNEQTNYGHVTTKNGLPNQRKSTLNEFTGVPESNSIHSVVDCNIEYSKRTSSLNTAIQELLPKFGSLLSIAEETVENLSIEMPTPDIISGDGAIENIFDTLSINSMDGSAPSIVSIQSMHSQEKKSISFFSTLEKRDSRQASMVSEEKSKSGCKFSVGKIIIFLLFIIALITGAYYVRTHGFPGHIEKKISGHTKEKNSEKNPDQDIIYFETAKKNPSKAKPQANPQVEIAYDDQSDSMELVTNSELVYNYEEYGQVTYDGDSQSGKK